MAFLNMPPLRIPTGWRVGWNVLCSEMADDLAGIGGSTLYNATNDSRRFNTDVAFRAEFDPEGHFKRPRSERGRHIKVQPLSLLDGQVVHSSEAKAYSRLMQELEHWIAYCSVWEIDGH